MSARQRLSFTVMVALTLALMLVRGVVEGAGPKSPTPAADARVSGRLLDPDGKPLGGAVVCLCARNNLDVYDGKFPADEFESKEKLRAWKNGDGEWWFDETDADGRYTFPRPQGDYTLLASTDAGYVLAKSNEIPPAPTLRLSPWAPIEGVVTSGGKPAGAGIGISGFCTEPHFQSDGPYLHYNVVTDAQGRFTLPRAVAGEYSLHRNLKGSSGVPITVKAEAGKVNHVTIPILGPAVTGRLQIPERLRDQKDLFIETTYIEPLVQLPSVTLPADVLATTPAARDDWYEAWSKTPEGKQVIARHAARGDRQSVRFKPDGSFLAPDVPVGAYTLGVMFFARKNGRIDYEHRLGLASYALTVPPGTDAAVDVQTLEPHAYGTLDAGQAAPDFVFRTLDGKERTLSELKGKVVLLDFWGVWCGACQNELPHLRKLHEAFANNPRFAMISLSVDDEPAVLEKFVRENNMPWTQAILGDRHKAWPVTFYQVSGYPTFYVVGRDGKVLAHGHWSADLEPIISKALGASGSP
jgi:thiol-disulfide isomerase/thioredoxin